MDNPELIEHVCRDGHQDWGTPEDCPNCGLKLEYDKLQGLSARTK